MDADDGMLFVSDDRHVPPLKGSRRWNELTRTEQDRYMLTCFDSVEESEALANTLDIYDRMALSIRHHLHEARGTLAETLVPLAITPEQRHARVLAMTAYRLRGTPLGQRLRAAIDRERQRDHGVTSAPAAAPDVDLRFEPIHVLAPQRGWEWLADSEFGGYERAATVDPSWMDHDDEDSDRGIDESEPTPAAITPRVAPVPLTLPPWLASLEPVPTWPGKLIMGTVALLIWALLPFNPYSYYVMLRWVVCGVLAWQATVTRANGMWVWMVALGLGSILYNPLIAFRFPRGTWSLINIVTVIALLVLPFAYGRRARRP